MQAATIPGREKVCVTVRESGGVQSLRERTAAKVTGLSRLIGYQTTEVHETTEGNYAEGYFGVQSVKMHMREIWRNRGQNTTKNTVPLMSTFATAGQGKTELCMQLVLDQSLHEQLEGVDEVVSIHITFNQSTSFDKTLDRNPITAIAWRVVRELTHDIRSTGNREEVSCYTSLNDLIADIRSGLTPLKQSDKTLGILLCIDETLKIATADSGVCQEMLTHLGSLQQSSLELGLPTFVLFTGLYYANVIENFQTDSGRPLKLVTLPIMSSTTLQNLANRISSQIIDIALFDESFKARQFEMSAIVKRLVLWMCFMTGRHFRALEEAVKRIVSVVLSNSALANYRKNVKDESSRSVLGSERNYFYPEARYYTSASKTELEKWKNGKVRQYLSESFLSTIQAKLDDTDMFKYCSALFCELLWRFHLVTEDDFYSMENESTINAEMKGVLFIKNRKDESKRSVQLHVSLPYLFHAAPMIWQKQLGSLVVTTDRSDYILPNTALPLPQLLPVLFSNIGIAMDGLAADFPTSFEFIMPFIELLRCHVVSQKKDCPELNDILPGAIIVPSLQENTEILLAAWVTTSPILPAMRLSMPRKRPAGGEQQDAALLLVQDITARVESNLVAMMQPNDVDTPAIEYVARYFVTRDNDGNSTPILFLASMKLRERNTVGSLVSWAEDIHRLARKSGLKLGQYYAVLYGCWPSSSIDQSALPLGTIVVPAETLVSVLRPFGGGCLELLVREKSGIFV